MYANIAKIAINKIADTRFHFSLEVGARLKGQASALLKCIFEQLKTGQMPVLSCAATLAAKTLLAMPVYGICPHVRHCSSWLFKDHMATSLYQQWL